MVPVSPEEHVDTLIRALYSERVRRGLGKRTLAAKLSQLTYRSVPTCMKQISGWENGEKVPTLVNLIAWMQALGLTFTFTRMPVIEKGTDHAAS